MAIIDRNFSPGAQGVWAREIRSVLLGLPDQERPIIYGYIAGLGGRDISVRTIEEIYQRTIKMERPDRMDIWIGVREV